ncbi:hypothetical protein Q5H91_05545 [Sphingomonas sp. KR1UV-12]|uniref:Dolichyl-phosphate-mannose-protein mannosyltransferase n=1 Tax=Sphingomonas aurea TaxID=3063994 RepID=A0ABT9EI73_9SPHN|nr:hypothetical protein [Sphingomonas sp. KR1UV-12]MDP1026666.1 hypothetical protein [Sphingomonas sp. KR1UV-12]
MRRARSPLILPGPTRLATIGRGQARAVLAVLVLVLLLLGALPAADPAPDLTRQIGFHGAIVDRLRHGGEDYYTATAAALRGSDLPTRPFTAFPLPALATIAGQLSAISLLGLMAPLIGLVAAAWSRHFARPGPGRSLCFTVALAAAFGVMQSGNDLLPQLWAGLFIALSLALRRPGRWLESAAIGLAAAIVYEGAALYLAIMALAAWHDDHRREAAIWGGALLATLAVVAVHARAATDAVGTMDATTGWASAGPLAALDALLTTSGLRVLPSGVAAPLFAIALAGWCAWRDPLAVRAAATVIACLVLLAFLPGTAVTTGALVAPLVLLGLLPAIDGIRDLLRAALDSRRITVTRVVR